MAECSLCGGHGEAVDVVCERFRIQVCFGCVIKMHDIIPDGYSEIVIKVGGTD